MFVDHSLFLVGDGVKDIWEGGQTFYLLKERMMKIKHFLGRWGGGGGKVSGIFCKFPKNVFFSF